MRRRRADPRQHQFDNSLRNALMQAAESVEPGQDGLDKIRTKIEARQSARRRASWRRALFPPSGWLPSIVTAVVERFRRDPDRAGWLGLLRPAAAVTTGV